MSWRSQARLLEIHELEKRIKATSEELAGAESEGKEAASTAAAVQTALQDELEQARTEVRHYCHRADCPKDCWHHSCKSNGHLAKGASLGRVALRQVYVRLTHGNGRAM